MDFPSRARVSRSNLEAGICRFRAYKTYANLENLFDSRSSGNDCDLFPAELCRVRMHEFLHRRSKGRRPKGNRFPIWPAIRGSIYCYECADDCEFMAFG